MRKKTSDIIWQDSQHQELFDLLDLLGSPGGDDEVLQRLRDYTHYHFGLEEHYMEVLDYPGREEHLAAHERFKGEIDRLLDQHEAHDAQFREIISTFLTEWLTRHVFGIDKKLERFILESEAR